MRSCWERALAASALGAGGGSFSRAIKKKKRKYWAKREITKPKENTSLFQFLFAKHKITERCLTWLPCSILFGCSKQRGHSWEGGWGSRHTSFARRSGGTAGQSWAAGIPVIPVSPKRGLGWQNEPPVLHWTELETARHEQCRAASTSSCGDVGPSCVSSPHHPQGLKGWEEQR